MGPVIIVGLILLHREGLSLGRAAELSADQKEDPYARAIPSGQASASTPGNVRDLKITK